MSRRYALDRSLPVPLGVQLRGKIKYGITCGELTVGERLPSVREMAADIGIAPMTVAAVYRELQEAELLEARPGSGTFVAPGHGPDPRRRLDLQALQSRIDALLREAAALGFDPAAVADMISMRRLPPATSERVRLLFAGVFAAPTEAYAQAVQSMLPDGDTITSVTIDALRTDAAVRLQATAVDLVLTIADRRSELAKLLGPSAPPIVTISFLPAEPVRAALAALSPLRRVAIVSLLPDWLPVMAAGVERFAPHVAQVTAAVAGTREMHAILAAADVVVYATGAEHILADLPQGVVALEYRHLPNPADVEGVVLPMLDEFRRRPPPPGER